MVPDAIFHWLETKAFHALTDVEQQAVLDHFSAEEYEHMRFAMTAISGNNSAKRKEYVLAAYDRVHSQAPAPSGFNGWMWKAAAVLLPAGLLVGFFIMKRSNPLAGLQTAHVADTVYVSKPVAGPAEVIHDTVFLIRYKKAEKKEAIVKQKAGIPLDAGASENMQALTLEELSAVTAAHKGSSLEEDTLWKSFEPASL